MDVDGETPRLQWQNANTGGHIDSADYRYVYHGYEVTSSGGGSTALATGSVGNNWNIFGDLQDNGNAYKFIVYYYFFLTHVDASSYGIRCRQTCRRILRVCRWLSLLKAGV